MKHKLRIDRLLNLLRIPLGLTCVMALTACKEKIEAPLRFGINPWPGYEFVHLAKEKGLFKKNGVEVQLLDFASLNDNRLGYLRGQIDGMACTQIEMVQLLDKTDRRPVALYSADYSNGGDMILAGPSFSKLKDLAHKRIALEPGTLNIFVLSRALEQIGLPLDSVDITPFPQMDLPEKWKVSAFDGAVAYPPFSVELQKSGMHQVFTSKEIPGEVLDILVFDQTLLDTRPDDVKKFLQSIEDAHAYWTAHRQESDSIMALHMGVSVTEFAKIIENDVHICGLKESKEILATGGSAEQSLAKVHAILLKVGSVAKPFPAGKWVRDDFLP